MFSNKENVNILTSLLMAHYVRHAVVCPGSRNSPVVHNLASCKEMRCYPVTDERSAGFFAIGIAENTGMPVVLCVTSGSALLNVAPAVSEAYYRNIPLIVVSADRPASWIGQSDGQTIVQPNSLEPHVRKSVNLPEPKDEEEQWYCNRLVNEALIAALQYGGGPVHINVPLSEPLYEYSAEQLPKERIIQYSSAGYSKESLSLVAKQLVKAKHPIIVIGQLPYFTAKAIEEDLKEIRKHIVVLQERLSNSDPSSGQHTDELLAAIGGDEAYLPDYIVYVGGTIVSKRLKQFLRKARKVQSVLIDPHGEVHDVFMNLSMVVQSYPSPFFKILSSVLVLEEERSPIHKWQQWFDLKEEVEKRAKDFVPAYSQMGVVKSFHEALGDSPAALFYGNSSAVRLGNIYSERFIHVNRGVNGIEGSMSVAVGYAAVNDQEEEVYCVIGDLSFFYDQNALWNKNLSKHVKILLLNNGGGGIFHQMKGPDQSPYRDEMIAARHHTSAEGVCLSMGIHYLSAHNEEEMKVRMEDFMALKGEPVLLEVFTDADEDARVMAEYYKAIER